MCLFRPKKSHSKQGQSELIINMLIRSALNKKINQLNIGIHKGDEKHEQQERGWQTGS